MADTTTTGTPAAASELSLVTPDLTVIDGQVTTTSLQIAEHFGKRHADVMRAIRTLECPAEFAERNFALSEFTDSTGRKLPYYRITRDGFSFLAMGFTGKEAARWKVTFLETFRRMEAALTAQALPSPYITAAQRQQLRELVQIVVESGKQNNGETWNRLQRKMQVNSYKELTPEQFDTACDYLRSKMDGQSMAALVSKHFPQVAAPAPATDAHKIDAALAAANAVSAQVQAAVFKAIMAGADNWKHQRWMVSLITDSKHGNPPMVDDIESDAFVMSLPRLAKAIATPNGMLPTNSELANLIAACSNRLAERMGSMEKQRTVEFEKGVSA